jgi:hypothetical protein
MEGLESLSASRVTLTTVIGSENKVVITGRGPAPPVAALSTTFSRSNDGKHPFIYFFQLLL